MIRQPAGTHLAQLNVGHIRYPTDDPRMAEFMGALDAVNALAERSPGFVWRLKDDSNNATGILVSDDPTFLVNMSVWETPEELEHFVWNTVHKRIYQKKGSWFAPMSRPHFVMWWIPAGHTPTPQEALARLEHLTRHGPSEQAFGWESLANVALWKQGALRVKRAEEIEVSEAPMPLWEVFIRNRSGMPHKHAGSVHAADAAMALQAARDVYTRRGEAVSLWVVASSAITASDPGDKDELFEPTGTKAYRHPTFYKVPDDVGHM